MGSNFEDNCSQIKGVVPHPPMQFGIRNRGAGVINFNLELFDYT